MEQLTIAPTDRTSGIVRDNLARIRAIAIAGPALECESQTTRVFRVLQNRRPLTADTPLVLLMTHNAGEAAAAEAFQRANADLGDIVIVSQKGHNESVGNAVRIYRERFDADADPFTVKRHALFLTKRGGKGKANFVSPFLGGQGTTCGEWTRPMVRKPDGTVVKGFMKASVAVGFCPVECPYCYLNMPYTDGMDVAVNWEDLRTELSTAWRDYEYPINFGETSGLVEYDEWFADSGGQGSLIQYVIDSCAAARVTPFFLTKIRYPRYLRFEGKVQVGISLMPEPIRVWLAPHGSPADELLDSLAWASKNGAIDPVIRLTMIWTQRHLYKELLDRMVSCLGPTGWRVTLDILRFTPTTASIIARRYPDAAEVFADEIHPEGGVSLAQLARTAKGAKEHVKKIRPPEQRQAEIFSWFRRQLDERDCKSVLLTPCKADPDELLPLVRLKVISAMPCACYGCSSH